MSAVAANRGVIGADSAVRAGNAAVPAQSDNILRRAMPETAGTEPQTELCPGVMRPSRGVMLKE